MCLFYVVVIGCLMMMVTMDSGAAAAAAANNNNNNNNDQHINNNEDEFFVNEEHVKGLTFSEESSENAQSFPIKFNIIDPVADTVFLVANPNATCCVNSEVVINFEVDQAIEALLTIKLDNEPIYAEMISFKWLSYSMRFGWNETYAGAHVWEVGIELEGGELVSEQQRRFFILGGFTALPKIDRKTNSLKYPSGSEPAVFITWPPDGQGVAYASDNGFNVELATFNFDPSLMSILVYCNNTIISSTTETMFFVPVNSSGRVDLAVQLVFQFGTAASLAHSATFFAWDQVHKYSAIPKLPLPISQEELVVSSSDDSDSDGDSDNESETCKLDATGESCQIPVKNRSKRNKRLDFASMLSVAKQKNQVLFPDLTICVLTFAAPETLKHTLVMWRDTGLIASVNTTIILVQELAYSDFFITAEDYERVQVIGVQYNMGIGRGMAAAVVAARTKYVMFMEDDWILQPLRSHDWPNAIAAAIHILHTNTADFVRFRDNNEFEGTPMTLNCSLSNFLPQPARCKHWCSCFWGTTPYVWGEAILQMWMQLGVYKCHDDPEFLCFPSWMCPWTNNPLIYRREDFLESVGVVAAADGLSWKHWLETAVNYEFGSFCDRNLTVAVATSGIFVHDPLGEDEIIDGFSKRV